MHFVTLGLCLMACLMFGAALFGIDVQTAAGVNVPTTTETIAATGNPVPLPSTNGKAVIRAWVQLTVGASTTAVTLTVYAGNAIGGRVVGQQNANAGNFTAGQLGAFSCEFTDALSNIGGAQYCVSVKQTGATGNGTIQSASIDTMVLSG